MFNHLAQANHVRSEPAGKIRPAAGFSTPVLVSTNTNTIANGGPLQSPSDNPSVFEDSTGTIYTVYAANTSGGIWRIYFSYSTDGLTFSTPVTVDPTHTATTADVDPTVSVYGTGATAKIAVVYLHMTRYDAEGSYALYLSQNDGGSWTSSGTSSVDTAYTNIVDPSGAWDSNGNLLVGFWECDTGVGTCAAYTLSDLAVDVWTGGTTFSTTHEDSPFGTGAYSIYPGMDFDCYEGGTDCALLAEITNTAATSMYVELCYSTNEFSGTWATCHRVATGASDYVTWGSTFGAVVTHGDLAYSSATNAVAAYEVNTGTAAAPVYRVEVSYTSNSWTTETTVTSAQGSVTTTSSEATITVGESGTPVVTWVDASGNVQTTWSLTYPTTGWTFFSPIQVVAGGVAVAVAATTAVSPFRYDYMYLTSSATPQVYYTNFTGLSATAAANPTSVTLGQQVNFTSFPNNGYSPYTFSWSFGGACTPSCPSTALQNPVVNYTYAGTYPTYVIVTDTIGEAVNVSTGTITVTGTVTLISLALSPTTPSVSTGGSQGFTATPTCSSACPGTITYAWALTNSAMGTITGTGATVTFNAASTAGTVGIFVNATLSSVVQGASTVITITPAVTLSSVALSPVSPSVSAGNTQAFTATPTCSTTCPGTITYVWALTSTALGSLTGTGRMVNFTAGTTAGTLGIYVNATLGATTKGTSTVITVTVTPVVTLTAVGLSPTGPSVAAGGVQLFTATPTCSSTCPSTGITYVWTLTSIALGSISGTGTSVNFTAGSTPMTGGIYVNATLSPNTKEASTVITVTAPAPTLKSVALSPTDPSVASGKTQAFTATPTCSTTCTGVTITYVWSLSSSSLGSISGTTSSVTFTASTTAMTGAIFVNASLSGTTVEATTSITVTVTPAVTIVSVALGPTDPSVNGGKSVGFTATPTCSATCPSSGITYSWTLSSLVLGSISGSGAAYTFNAGSIAGTVGIFVNASLSSTKAEANTVITVVVPVVTLTSVAISPLAPQVAASSATPFTATPGCSSGATCPSGITYAWSLSGSSLGSITSSGDATTFNAGTTAGTVGLFVNATLGTSTQEANTVITVEVSPPVVTLNSVAVTPVSANVASGGKQYFTATPSCSSTCPTGITYQWSLTGNDGNLSATSGSNVTFIAGNANAVIGLKVVASYGGASPSATASITVKSTPVNNNVTSTPFPWWILIVVLVVVIAVMLLVMERRRRERNRIAGGAYSGAEATGAAVATSGGEEMAPTAETGDVGAMVDAGLGGAEVPPDLGPEASTPPPTEGEPLALTQCPQCGNPMGPDRVCYTCGVGWAPAETVTEAPAEPQAEIPIAETGEAPAAPPPPLTQCPQCGNQLGEDMVCLTCGVSWSADPNAGAPGGVTEPAPESPPEVSPPPAQEPPAEPAPEKAPEEAPPAQESAVVPETVPTESTPAITEEAPPAEPQPAPVEEVVVPAEPAPAPVEEPKEAPGEPKEAEPSPPETSTGEIPPEPPVPEPEVSPTPAPQEEVPQTGEEKPASGETRVCFICGGPLEGDYCTVCNMHWDTPS
jgi:ribosomal protein L32